MREKPTIQKFLASLLVVIFTISFIPQRFFHDVLAGHKDVVSCEHPGKNATCVHPQNFHCGFSDLVVSVPYLSYDSAIELTRLVHHITNETEAYHVLLPVYSSYTEGRGPPAL